MLKRRFLKLGLLLALMLGVVALGLTSVTAHPQTPQVFATRLTGAEEIPGPIDTPARGTAVFIVNRDESAVRFVLVTTRLRNAWMAHIHIGPPGATGPIAVWLRPEAAPPPAASIPGVFNGVFARGVITAADLTGPLAGMTIADLVDILEAGGAYVNVHSNDFVNPPNTGPGDFPPGEIRGQID